MKLIHVTSYTFPSKKAEPYHVKSLAEAFTEHLGKNLLFVINGTIPPELGNIETISLTQMRRFRTLYYFFWFPNFLRSHYTRGNDVVFFSNDPQVLLVFIFWRKVLRSKYRICADWHQLFDDWRDSIITKNCDYIVTTVQRLKDVTVTRCKVNPEKILVAYGGVDKNLFDKRERVEKKVIRETLGLPQDAFLIGYAGTFRSLGLEKGLSTMIAALPEHPRSMRMVFVGGTGDQILEYEALAEKLGVTDRCIFIPRQPFEKIISYEEAMDVLVIPYPDQHHFRDYGFPIKVWEYMATGRPIIYSNLEIIDEVLKGRGTPFVPDSPTSLAEAILSVSSDMEKAESISKKNTVDIALYTWSKKALKILEFFGYSGEKSNPRDV